MKKPVFILALLVTFIACNKDDDSTGTIFEPFEMIVHPDYLRNDSFQETRFWVLVYSEDYELLIKQEIQNGMVYSFDSVQIPQRNLIVQTLKLNRYLTSENYDATCYAYAYKNIRPGSWKFGIEYPDYSKLGNIVVKTTDFELFDFNIYDLTSSIVYSGLSYGSSEQFTYQLGQYVNPDEVWLMVQNENEIPRYKYFKDISLNDTIVTAFDQLVEMTDYKDITFPENENMSISIQSMENISDSMESYYKVYSNFWDNGSTSIRIYYPGELFQKYYSFYRISDEFTTQYMLKNNGNIPSELELLDIDFSVSESSLSNFTASINGAADLSRHNWSFSETLETGEINFYYYLYGKTEDSFHFNAPDIPEEIKSLHPQLFDLNKLIYYYSSFYEYDIFSNYQNFIEALKEEQLNLNIEEYLNKVKYFYSAEAKYLRRNDSRYIPEEFKIDPFKY